MPSAGVKVYVGNLPERSNPEDIKECFAKYGNVVNMELKGNYGFIEYEERHMCEEAINTLDGTEFQGSQLRVEFAHGERNTTSKNQYNHHHHHSNHYSNNNSNSNRGETKSTDTCYKCGMVGHWARECTSTGREFIRKPGRYDDRRTNDNYVKEPYNTRENRDKYIRDERYLPPPTLERGGYDRPYERYGREPPEVEYRRDYRGGYDRPYERERDRPYDRNYPDREYERFNRDNYDRNYYGPPRDGYERDGYDRRPLPPPDVTQSHYPPRGRPTSPPLPPRRGSYERGIREPQISSYRGRSPLATSRYPEPLMGPPPLRPSSPRGGGVYRRRSVSPPIRGGRASIPYSGRRSPSPIPRQSLSSRRGPSTPSPRR